MGWHYEQLEVLGQRRQLAMKVEQGWQVELEARAKELF